MIGAVNGVGSQNVVPAYDGAGVHAGLKSDPAVHFRGSECGLLNFFLV